MTCLLFVTVLSTAARGDSFQGLNLQAGYEDNVPKGLDSKHQLGSGFIGLEASGGIFHQLGLNDSITYSVNFAAERFFDLGGFDNIGIGLAASHTHKFGFGAMAPKLISSLSLAHENYQEEARDNNLFTAEVVFEKRLSPAWLVSIGADYQNSFMDSLSDDPLVEEFGYDADVRLPGELFDYDSVSVFAAAEYTFANGMLVSGAYRRVDGYTVSSTSDPSIHLYKISEAFHSDPAFAWGWFAYLLKADIDEFSVAVSVPVARDASVDFSYDWFDIAAPESRDYDNSVFSITYIRDF